MPMRMASFPAQGTGHRTPIKLGTFTIPQPQDTPVMLNRTPLRCRPVLAEDPQAFIQAPLATVPKPELAGSLLLQPGSLLLQPENAGSMRIPTQIVSAGSFVAPPQMNSFAPSTNLISV